MKFSLAVSALLCTSGSAQNVVEVAVSLPETFSTLVDLVTAADLGEALSTTPDITVFAPTNDAFGELDSTVVSNLLTPQWNLHLQDTLLYHVVASVIPSSAVTEETTVVALNAENITAAPAEGTVVLNDSSNVIQADVEADNGVIHVIDEVLLPSWVTNSIVDRAKAAPALSTLVELVVQAQLVDTLSSDGPFTVFAPTNDALMEAITALTSRSAVETPLDTDLVSTLLTYHVVEGIYPSLAIEDGLELETVQGELITFGLSDTGATVNGEGIVGTDILANNGIVHVIDGVLVPQAASDMLDGTAPETTMAPSDSAGYSIGIATAFCIAVAATMFGM